ncbi:period circadian protein homolog 1-like [Megalops cyprinoides]|uniref:period circadian protein homolog 1-like n=1 Tax=Megalops cyprinoides TaxID=118141 RepID=UPI001863C805|nr:period circadian protein homolog 1-like [Megalops cyprinoides]XP_036403619.1 period circadian protein homolog 1-like [Megalops cyprinoides]XP_036403620.1 period circadian protein homolog 1-like [Megalops cyprinoides]XP_036403621.1 period circadian protein homolog 1-like [Megalops cyprinoides]
MSDGNSDSAPSNDPRSGEVAEEEEEAGQGARSPGLLAGSSSLEASREGASPRGGSGAQTSPRDLRAPNSDDMDALSSGNDSRENVSRGWQSTRSSHSSSSQNGKDSAVNLETTESNKSSNSHSSPPPSSSVAYSLLSASSEQDHPSSSGCSSEQSARLQTQKQLLQALKELKIRVPADRKAKGGSHTLNALKYALNCVKQARANQEYYHQWSVDSHSCSLDLSTFTIEELDNITSEYTLKNTDTFSMAISFLSGKVVYISPQGSSLLRCKPESLQGVQFSELLAPQDVSTFYSHTAPCRLPPWAACMGSGVSPVECTQEKSMFCRISGGREYEGEVRYSPFRLTPYQLMLHDSDTSHPQPCCLLIAERVHSGYEAPRIPPDKRIFTTSHTPSCLFQEVDERAVPLLGYLPQDLVGTPVLLYLHPEDRPVMVAIHQKILQFAGQPFDHSPLRICARSGEYLTIDTSWSSFVNPWSRKVVFIVGRHKVRSSPLNEDVFSAPRAGEGRVMVPEIQQLSEQIHRVLVQPVHSGSSQGYCSLGSNGSHEPHPSAASSSDSTGAAADEPAPLHKPMTFQQICKDIHMVKSSGQQVFIESRNRPTPRKHPTAGAVATLKTAEMAKPAGHGTKEAMMPPNSVAPPTQSVRKEPAPAYSYQQINCLDSIIRYLESCNVPNTVKRKSGSSSCTASSASDEDRQSGAAKGAPVALAGDPAPLPPLALHSKAESVASVTSQCSFSSTIVHVGDKKPPESDIVMEEAPPTPTPAPPPALPAAPPPPAPTTPPSPAALDRDGRRGGVGRRGLTKEVLLAHTQLEEQAFLGRFQDLSQLHVFDPSSAPHPAQRRHTATPSARGVRSSQNYPAGSSGRRRGRGGKRLKQQEVSDQGSSLRLGAPYVGGVAGGAGGPQTSSPSWPASVVSQASLPPVPYPGVLPLYPLYPPLAPPLPRPAADAHQAGLPTPESSLRYPPHLAPPLGPPMVAFVLPNYIFPQPNPPIPQASPATPSAPQHFYNPSCAFPFTPTAPATPSTAQPPSTSTATPRPPSRCTTPQSCSQPPPEREGAESPLFQSRCSSPLNLLQLEELPSNRLEVTSALAPYQQAKPPVTGAAQDWTAKQGGGAGGPQASSDGHNMSVESKETENAEANESSNQDALSTSSDLLELLLQEDSRWGTGSAASGSGSSGSGSNGCSTAGSGTRSSQSSRTSKYFGSVDSSENERSFKQPAGGAGEEQLIKYVLQDPIWLLMADTDDKVMMTYQLPVRDREEVLWGDRVALKDMQKQQPRFSERQKRELSQVHPWIRTGHLPPAIDVPGCVGCGSSPDRPELAPFIVEVHDMELSGVLASLPEEGAQRTPDTSAATALPRPTLPEEQTSDQEMTAEEQEVTSQMEEGKGAAETGLAH